MKLKDNPDSQNAHNEVFSKLQKNMGHAAKNTGIAAKRMVVNAKDTVLDKGTHVGEQISRLIDERHSKKYRPVFEDTLTSSSYSMPSIVQLIDYDKHLKHRVCAGAIGFETQVNSVRVLSVYCQSVPMLGLRFYPECKLGTYYADPCVSNLYIGINEYFSYMKKVRMDELESVAQSLGATHFKVELKAQETNHGEISGNIHGGFKKNKVQSSITASDYSKTNVCIEAESNFAGNHQAQIPTLAYFQDDTNILSLISMRMDTKNPLHSKTYLIQYGKSSGIKLEQTADIGLALTAVKCSAAEAFKRNAQNEHQTILQYTIDFPE